MTQEQIDLEKMLQKIKKAKEQCYNFQVYCTRVQQSDLLAMGYQDLASALQKTITRTSENIEKLTKEHLRRYPDL